jgi:cold shock CspA family protein
MADYDWQNGTIARMGAKGFGFIQPAADEPRVFFHVKDCSLRNTRLEVGGKVEFLLNQFRRNGKRREAAEVRVINAAR